MIIKLAALGALGYAGYRYFRSNEGDARRHGRAEERVTLAGGPLSDSARVQHSAAPPSTA